MSKYKSKTRIGLGNAELFISPHILKCDEHAFISIMIGTKKCEIRDRDDRDFKIGDILVLQEWDRAMGAHTGREIIATTTHIQEGYGMPCNICALSIEVLEIIP